MSTLRDMLDAVQQLQQKRTKCCVYSKQHDLLFLPCCVSDTGPPTGSDALTADLTTDGRPHGQVAKTHVQLSG